MQPQMFTREALFSDQEIKDLAKIRALGVPPHMQLIKLAMRNIRRSRGYPN